MRSSIFASSDCARIFPMKKSSDLSRNSRGVDQPPHGCADDLVHDLVVLGDQPLREGLLQGLLAICTGSSLAFVLEYQTGSRHFRQAEQQNSAKVFICRAELSLGSNCQNEEYEGCPFPVVSSVCLVFPLIRFAISLDDTPSTTASCLCYPRKSPCFLPSTVLIPFMTLVRLPL